MNQIVEGPRRIRGRSCVIVHEPQSRSPFEDHVSRAYSRYYALSAAPQCPRRSNDALSTITAQYANATSSGPVLTARVSRRSANASGPGFATRLGPERALEVDAGAAAWSTLFASSTHRNLSGRPIPLGVTGSWRRRSVSTEQDRVPWLRLFRRSGLASPSSHDRKAHKQVSMQSESPKALKAPLRDADDHVVGGSCCRKSEGLSQAWSRARESRSSRLVSNNAVQPRQVPATWRKAASSRR